MVLVDDEQSVGGFASDGADEPFGVGVGLRTSRWDFHDFDTSVGEDGVERGGELACLCTAQKVIAAGQAGCLYSLMRPPRMRVRSTLRGVEVVRRGGVLLGFGW
ncbi:hypothetical protein AB0G02_18245 [Actinosynnema sp. NPDC023658]|uniref:hypothetical protein n=1 Tax=Actinosynnema sp. NPDC023658 TaxID=3155465 RepID=UPI0033EA7E91